MKESLTNLTPKRLLVPALAHLIANPLLHDISFLLQGDTQNVVNRFFAVFMGNLSGALIVLYAVRVFGCCYQEEKPPTSDARWRVDKCRGESPVLAPCPRIASVNVGVVVGE
ncbi:hypothetical protein NE850_29335 [Paraburkholderia sp. USG1]|uniref:hypothetical protein n=1 Tax=Paraburkholderia sp. USG1 TaxID=2952268 RepID=UPI002854F309|nr:hypothetical protein [Paraburkholderia sp. USG1]MDR8400420.1 hypothetical protein [Paraburkholderia sp. USG1]